MGYVYILVNDSMPGLIKIGADSCEVLRFSSIF